MSTQIDEGWTAEQRASFLGLDLRAMRRTMVVLAALAFVALASITVVVLVGLEVLAPAESIPLPLMLAGLGIGVVVGAAASVSLSLLISSRLALARPMVQQSVVVTSIVVVGYGAMSGAQALGGSPWLISVALGLTAWALVEGAWQHSVVFSALRTPTFPRRGLAMLAAQRAELGLGGHATVLGLSPTREALAGLSRAVVVISCAALMAFSPIVGLLAALVRLLADLADVAALTTQRHRLISIAPAVAAALLVVAVAALY
ncbi:hypothetical protein [Microcella humidisoli]|uniref:ABC transporter permease n=1 Tax=Microcella humidisoli TaxID=2963406 RepID=A0ABY5FUD6_9MICO|nr:hypothetical protein [Microcella humidisoli]UTT61921.1 hypothetical protein NNL39_09585 [Microcella humidisoli]